ncbi:hypothetical protein [Lacinutrix chionoecetis]
MKKTILLFLAILAFSSVSAQQELNDYKYVIVPKTYDFLKEADQYRVNSLTQFLFEKYNFEAFMEGDILPSDYGRNNCLGLKADVLKKSTLFKTKLTLQLKNCKEEIIYTSPEGTSREKNFKVAYNEALRNAFENFENVNYQYNPENAIKNTEATPLAEASQEEIKKLKDEIKILKETKNETKKEELPKKQETPVSINSKTVKEPSVAKNTLYSQATSNGFLLLDKTPKVVYTILNSGKKDVFIVKDKEAVIYKLNGKWVIAEVKGDDLQVKALDIKF